MNLYNTILEKLVLPIGDLLNGSQFQKELENWRRIQYLSKADLANIQKTKLQQLLIHIGKKIPFYKEYQYQEESSPFDFVSQLPIVGKSEQKSSPEAFLDPESRYLIEYMSSGSSGIQGRVFMTKKEQSIIRAILIMWWEWAGYKIGNPLLQTGITPDRGVLKKIKDRLLRTRYYDAFGLNQLKIVDILLKQANENNFILGGYASSLYLLAEVAKNNGIKNVKFKSAISWGDKLFSHYRSSIQNSFGAKVYDNYACNEGIMIAAQKDLEYYYIMSPHVYLEIVDSKGNQVPDGEMGHVLVTRLDSYSMPLIRYRLGDLACKLPAEEYPKNRELNFPLLKKIIGRDTDIVKTRSDKFMIVHFFTGIFEFYPTVKQFKVIQKSLDSICIEYIPDKNFDASILNEIKKRIQDHLKERFPVHFVKVDQIYPSKSGKPQIIQSHLQKDIFG